jgi:predicted ATP-dependent endonuclease of OLD family
MKLIRLSVKSFKNLKDFNLDFQKHKGLSIFVGNNGSGKSNFLEAISGIFKDIFSSAKTFKSEFEIEYEIDVNGTNTCVVFTKKQNKIECTKDGILNKGSYKDLLPDNVVALYSGEDDRLWNNFYKYMYFYYLSLVSRQSDVREKLIYVNKYYWNIALLLLGLKEDKDFFVRYLGSRMISKVTFEFKQRKSPFSFPLYNSFLGLLNPNKLGSVSYSLDQLREVFNSHIESPKTIATFFMHAFMPKRSKRIYSIVITFDDGTTTADLSEGVKKIILLRYVLECVATERSLVLLDEPDAHVNETNKRTMFTFLKEYTSFGRHIVMTTHSPTLVDVPEADHIVMLRTNASGTVEQFAVEKLEAIQHLTGSRINAFSNRPIILVEGKSDIFFIDAAASVLNIEVSADIYPFGGTGNANDFLTKLRESVGSTRKIVVLFDRDNAGLEGMNQILPQIKSGKNAKLKNRVQNVEDFNSYSLGETYCLMLPLPSRAINPFRIQKPTKQFLLEDYLPASMVKSLLQKEIIDPLTGDFHSIPNKIREDMKGRLSDIAKEKKLDAIKMADFRVLLDKLNSILNGKDTLLIKIPV